MNEIINGNCVEAMASMTADSFDACITDPPYELGFMGKKWDNTGIAFQPSTWAACLRVLKPGAHLLAFGGTRTFHRIACAIEDAGFEIRDCIMWVYGSGFPKSHNLGGEWEGWGTALKPAWEPIIVARKPLIGTVAGNVDKHGCGALNIDGCRVPADEETGWKGRPSKGYGGGLGKSEEGGRPVVGRWPANLIHDGSEEVEAHFPKAPGQQGNLKGYAHDRISPNGVFGVMGPAKDHAARFFYCAKASKSDRNSGCENMELKVAGSMSGRADGSLGSVTYNNNNTQPTVKPVELMRYLCRLITPPGGTVIDPFNGSGSTGKAAVLEGFNYVGIEREAEYCEIARARIAYAERQVQAARAEKEQAQTSLFTEAKDGLD